MIRRALFAVLISTLGIQSAVAVCNVAGPHYSLTSDTVEWMLIIASGQSCTQGLRLRTTALETVAVTAEAQHGQVAVRGSGWPVAVRTADAPRPLDHQLTERTSPPAPRHLYWPRWALPSASA